MKIRYRPEIDGLRSIAVLAVIIYHFSIDGVLTGGYLGVDVFFVISGFLISSIILKELKSTGTFSFLNFYKRRIRRLMPVFFVVLLTSIVFGWFILLPTQLDSFAKSGIASIFFFSNFYWYFSSLVYEAQSSLFEPLLHTWTLSIEEQFYFIFPGILFLIYSYRKKYLLSVVVLITILSLVSAELCDSYDESLNFYLLPTRFWEMSIGGILAILIHQEKKPKFKLSIFKYIPSISFCVLVVSFILFNHETKHPSFITLIPVLATMCMLYFANEEDLITKILSTQPFIKIGLLSYSLYLWHFPVFAFGRNLNGNLTYVDYTLWIVITFILSYLSNTFIENPYRKRKVVSSKKFNITISIFLLLSLSSLVAIVINKGFPERTKKIAAAYLGNEVDNKILKEQRDDLYDSLIKEPINNENKQKVLFIGDSHSRDLYLSFKLNESLFPEYSFNRIKYRYDNKSKLQLTRNKSIKNADVAIICYRFIEKKHLLKPIEDFIEYLKNEGKRVIVVLNNAEFQRYGRAEVFDQYIEEYSPNDTDLDYKKMYRFFYDNRITEVSDVNSVLKSIIKKQEVEYLDRYSLVCNDNAKTCECATDTAKKSYTDTNHWSLDGAKYFGQKMKNQNYLYQQKFVEDSPTFLDISDLNDPVRDRLSPAQKKEYDNLCKVRRLINVKLRKPLITEKERQVLLEERSAVKKKIKKFTKPK